MRIIIILLDWCYEAFLKLDAPTSGARRKFSVERK